MEAILSSFGLRRRLVALMRSLQKYACKESVKVYLQGMLAKDTSQGYFQRLLLKYTYKAYL
jgi:hypothetical protein